MVTDAIIEITHGTIQDDIVRGTFPDVFLMETLYQSNKNHYDDETGDHDHDDAWKRHTKCDAWVLIQGKFKKGSVK